MSPDNSENFEKFTSPKNPEAPSLINSPELANLADWKNTRTNDGSTASLNDMHFWVKPSDHLSPDPSAGEYQNASKVLTAMVGKNPYRVSN